MASLRPIIHSTQRQWRFFAKKAKDSSTQKEYEVFFQTLEGIPHDKA